MRHDLILPGGLIMDREQIATDFKTFTAERFHLIPEHIRGNGQDLQTYLLRAFAGWCRMQGHDVSMALYDCTQLGAANIIRIPDLFLETLPPVFDGREELAAACFPAFLDLVKKGQTPIDRYNDQHLHETFWDFMVGYAGAKYDAEWNAYQVAQAKRQPFLDVVAGED